jgi:O-acetyl-ADP-ribose deacetylase (regulator of RNase III)
VPNINHALQALKKEVREQNVKSLALPRLATGVGGLAWEDVKPLLDALLKDLGIAVYVYSTYRKGVAAQEE